MSYKERALKGVLWIGGYRGVVRVASLFRTALLARLLTPADVGLVAIATTSLTLLEIFTETGINTVLIQLKDKIDEYIDTAWTVSILRGVGIFVVIYLVAPFISSFFNTPAAIDIIRLSALIPLVRGFINPAEIVFQKELYFRSEFVFRTVLFVFDAVVAVSVALVTRSPYSIIYGLLAGALVEVVISHGFISPRPRLRFRREKFQYIFARGKWMTATGIFDYLFQNADNILVGRMLGATPLGLYGYMYQISTTPVSEVSNILSKVTFPIFMKMSEDKAGLWKAYKKTLFVVFGTSFPIALLLFLFPASPHNDINTGSKTIIVIAPVADTKVTYSCLCRARKIA